MKTNNQRVFFFFLIISFLFTGCHKDVNNKVYIDENNNVNNCFTITLTHEESIKFKEYTVADFPEVELSAVFERPSHIEQNKDYKRFFDLVLVKSDKQNLINSMYKIAENPIVEYVQTYLGDIIEPMYNIFQASQY